VVSGAIVSALQTVVARTIAPTAPAVVTIAEIRGGKAFNVIPPDVTMRGTARWFDPGRRPHRNRGRAPRAAHGRGLVPRPIQNWGLQGPFWMDKSLHQMMNPSRPHHPKCMTRPTRGQKPRSLSPARTYPAIVKDEAATALAKAEAVAG
jgi:hypothetical protein